ncbi:hypothetical protein, partial [Stenoxybacter acetivorans]|uniref:hypothetical protein n=1 Tax=Stenoxybacter acetivorans TaxID=422441 RepID=UPI00055DCF7A
DSYYLFNSFLSKSSSGKTTITDIDLNGSLYSNNRLLSGSLFVVLNEEKGVNWWVCKSPASALYIWNKEE